MATEYVFHCRCAAEFQRLKNRKNLNEQYIKTENNKRKEDIVKMKIFELIKEIFCLLKTFLVFMVRRWMSALV